MAERNRLEAQKERELEELKVELDTELQSERRNLQERREDKASSVKQVMLTSSGFKYELNRHLI